MSLDEEEGPNLVNSRDMRFMIVPKLKYEFHKEYKKATNELKMVTSQFKALPDHKKADHQNTVEKFKTRCEKALERAKLEFEVNEDLISTSIGRDICYGMDIMFRHVDSGMFLCAKDECPESERMGDMVELTRFYQSKMVFQLIPRYKSREIGNKIQFSDFVHIKHVKSKKFLCISDTQQIPAPENCSQNEKNPFL